MTGTLINAAAILGLLALFSLFPKLQMSPRLERLLKNLIVAFTFFTGIKLMIKLFDPGFQQGLGFIIIAVVSLIIGNIAGKILKIQDFSNRLGQFALRSLMRVRDGERISFNDRFAACVVSYCLNPIGITGALLEGATSNYYILIVKSAMDGFSAPGFAKVFGALPIALSILPLIVWQGFISLVAMYAVKSEFFSNPTVGYSIDGVCALLCFIFVLPILEIKKVNLANYLPSLIIAPFIARLFL